MKKGTFTVKKRRKLEGKTNYKKRLKLLKSGKPRLVIRTSLKNIMAQIVEYDTGGDKVLSSAYSLELLKMDWKLNTTNLPAAYLTGLLLGTKTKVKEAIVDIGLNTSVRGSKFYAVVKGVIDAGVKINVGKDMFPSDDRIKGLHIAKYMESLDEASRTKCFSKYMKNKVKKEDIEKMVDDTKKKILSMKVK